MSDTIVRETLQAIRPDELLEAHQRLKLPVAASMNGNETLVKESLLLFTFGHNLQYLADSAGWEDQFGGAMRSGSDRLFLSTLKVLRPMTPSVAQAKARGWLRGTTPKLYLEIGQEATAIIEGDEDKDEVAERAEDELRSNGYPAFAELSSSLEPYLLEEELTTGQAPMQEASWARVGTALAGLAISRCLADEDPLEALYRL